MSEKGRGGKRSRRQTKDRVLQARIPEQLDEELRDRAEQLGMSVSTVVRNVLFHTFDLVEGVVTDSAQLARVIKGQQPPLPLAPEPVGSDPESSVLGWQEVVLNRNGICETCNTILPLGAAAAIGVPAQPRPVLLCLDCLGALAPPAEEDSAPPSPGKRKKKGVANTSRRGKKTS